VTGEARRFLWMAGCGGFGKAGASELAERANLRSWSHAGGQRRLRPWSGDESSELPASGAERAKCSRGSGWRGNGYERLDMAFKV